MKVIICHKWGDLTVEDKIWWKSMSRFSMYEKLGIHNYIRLLIVMWVLFNICAGK